MPRRRTLYALRSEKPEGLKLHIVPNRPDALLENGRQLGAGNWTTLGLCGAETEDGEQKSDYYNDGRHLCRKCQRIQSRLYPL